MQNIDMKIPTAANARKMVEESILGSSNQTKEKIDALIIEGIKKRSFQVSFTAPPSIEEKILKEHYLHLGYKWDHKDGQRDCDYIILSW